MRSERKCGSIELKSKSGWLRVFERHEDEWGQRASYGLAVFEHPNIHVVFVRAKHESRNGDFSTEVDTLIEVPQKTLSAIELASQAEHERLRGDLDVAIEYLETSI